jgi:hypothetical protein
MLHAFFSPSCKNSLGREEMLLILETKSFVYILVHFTSYLFHNLLAVMRRAPLISRKHWYRCAWAG